MSSMPSDVSFNAASLDRLGGHVAFDDLRQQPGSGLAPADGGSAEAPRGPQEQDDEKKCRQHSPNFEKQIGPQSLGLDGAGAALHV